MLTGEEFDIRIGLPSNTYKVHVKCIYSSPQIERYLLTAGGKEAIFRTDRPYVTAMKRKKKIQWKIEKGDASNALGLFKCWEAIEEYADKASA